LPKIRQVVNDTFASLDGELAPLYVDFDWPSTGLELAFDCIRTADPASLIQILFYVR
jgi:hypothetical protein